MTLKLLAAVLLLGASTNASPTDQPTLPLGCSAAESERLASEMEGYQGSDPSRSFELARPFVLLEMPCELPAEVRVLILSADMLTTVQGGQLVGSYPLDTTAEVSLPDIADATEELGWLSEIDPGIFHLDTALIQLEDTTIEVAPPEVRELRIENRLGAFLGGRGASLFLDSVVVTSWDSTMAAPDSNSVDGRPFIVYKQGGRLEIANSVIQYLGADRTLSYGLSWRKGTSGSLTDSEVHYNLFGVFTYETSDLVIQGNTIHNNERYGIDPHDFSSRLLIADNDVHSNGSHGIVVSKGVNTTSIEGNVVYNNEGNGIMIDARSDQNKVVNNEVTDNGGHGIVNFESADNLLMGNRVSGQSVGIRVSGEKSVGNQIVANDVTDNDVGISVYGLASETLLADNLVAGSKGAGVIVRNSSGTLLQGGSIQGGDIGIRVAAETEVLDLNLSGSKTGVKVIAPAEVLVARTSVQATNKGVVVEDGAIVSISKSTLTAPKPLTGNASLESTKLETTGDSTLLPRIGIALIVIGVLLEVFRAAWGRSRGRHRRKGRIWFRSGHDPTG